MRTGKQHIHTLPINDITNLGSIAQQAQREAEAQNISLPPPLRLHIGEPSFHTPEHINQATIETLQTEPLTYGPPAGWPWLRDLLAEKLARVNGYRVRPENTAVTVGGTGAILSSLPARALCPLGGKAARNMRCSISASRKRLLGDDCAGG
jgi:aspartate/methionine/tyrosine aminotransferase